MIKVNLVALNQNSKEDTSIFTVHDKENFEIERFTFTNHDHLIALVLTPSEAKDIFVGLFKGTIPRKIIGKLGFRKLQPSLLYL